MAIVSGSVTPDSYVVEKSPRNILDINVSHQGRAMYRIEGGGSEWKDLSEAVGNSQVLTEGQINELSDIILRIENHHGFPCDIEWAFEAGVFYIVQSRPITTLSNIEGKEEKVIYGKHQRDYSILGTSVVFHAYHSKNTRNIFQIKTNPYFIEVENDILYHFIPEEESKERALSYTVSFSHEDLSQQKIDHDKILKEYRNFLGLSNDANEGYFQSLFSYFEKLLPLILVAIEVPEYGKNVDQKMIDVCMQIRKENEDVYKVGFDKLDRMLSILGHEKEIDSKLLAYLTYNEFIHFLSTGKVPKKLKNREIFVLIQQDSEDEDIFLTKSSLAEFGLEREEVSQNIDTIQGKVAYPGTVSGKVRIIQKIADIENLLKGEVLVAAMTDPRYVLAMQKALAIVTDEGGITCHAAIVSRELNIPCIIGTKIATQVLKDGDLVEVDADNGVVRIMERSSKENHYISQDYYLLFQTNGVNFFFTDLCTQYYDKFNGVTLSLDNEWRYYVHVSEREFARDLYASFYKDAATVEASSERFLQVMTEASESRKQLEKADTVSAFDTFTAQSAIFLNEYAIYDHMYTDYLFTDTRTEVPELIQLVQEKKNVFREYLNQFFFNEDSYLMLLIQKISQEKDIPVNELLYSSVDKIRAMLSGDTFVPQGKDGDDYALVRDNGEFSFFFGKDAQEFIGNFLAEESLESTKEVKGISVAKKGIYQGYVKKVTVDYANLQKSVQLLNMVEEGVVLVTESTVPEMLPVMSKSLAIVTDMGGMLSHAAITARELEKPCIIGTVFATRILKDGDLVEVDADNGVVRILEREEKLEIDKYQKLFQWPGEFSHFLSSYFMAIYNKHRAISLHDGNMWQSFLPHTSKEETLKSGLILYSSEQKYKELSEGLTQGFVLLADHFDQVLAKDVLTKEDVASLFDQALQHYNYYSQTEFFFTDLAYTEMNNISQIQKNFETFDELKLRGREHLNKIALAPGCYLDQLLEKIAVQLGCDTNSLKCHSINEILELFDGKVMTPDELANRNQYFMHGKGTHTEVLTGSTALGKIRDFFEEVTRTNELKGQIANKGYYKGVARVFRFSLSEINLMDDEIEKMIKGEILIADTTAPEIILACKKAGAIVTNQGGMMSHAAIVARELNIPCIVGTGHITEIVKTGDLVEVDADNGVVKIL